MNTFLSGLATGLPNLHPAVVHFPLALLPAAVLFDLVLLVWARAAWTDRAASWLYALAAIGAVVAVRAGEAAKESLGALTPAARALLHEHERLADRAVWVLVALALLRAIATWRDRHTGVVPRGVFRLILLAGSIAAVALVASVADHGSRLVYQHGVAVTAPSPDPQ